jgi:Fic family protein
MAKTKAKTTPEKRSAAGAAIAENILVDRGEDIDAMEPMLIGESSHSRGEMSELAIELTYQAADFRSSLPNGVRAALSELVRNMNCYYSNLIEGHDTHPIAIERALNGVYDKDPKKRNLQLEAKAHITVQRWIDEGGIAGNCTAAESVRAVHRRFVECLPDELRVVEHPETKELLPVIPGEYREYDVKVGMLVPVSPGAVPRFMNRYEGAYARLTRAQGVLSAPAAHHRLVWIHPFLDGNGRVARLISHAMLADALGTGSVWSVARGFARNVDEYKRLLAACDLPRRNDLDGRGARSEEALVDFTRFFLQVCIDQVAFMRGLMQPDSLRARILTWTREEIRLGSFPKTAVVFMESLLFRGELPRADIPVLIQGSERSAARLASQLNGFGVITSASSRAPWRLALPATLAHRWFPGLYPASSSPA